MRTYLQKSGIALLFILSLLANSCKNYEDFGSIDGIDYQGEMALPLVQGNINLQDIMDDNDIQNDLSALLVHNDGSLSLVYENNQIRQSFAERLDTLPDFPLLLPDNANEVPVQLFEDMTVHQMRLKSGSLSFEMQSPFTEDVNVLITLPNLTKNGEVFTATQTIPFDGSAPSEANISPIDLTGYTLQLDDNSMQLYYQAVTASGNNVQIMPILGMAENWDFDLIKGNWNSDTFQLDNDTLQIEIYQDWVAGEINFADPQLTLAIQNSFGFPTQIQIQQLCAISTSGNTLCLQGDAMAQGIDVAFPNSLEQGQSKETVFQLNQNNSNIADLLNSRPEKILYGIQAIINPQNDDAFIGFMTDQSTLDFAIKTELPIYGTATGFETEQTLQTNLSELENVETVEFKVIIDNGMPIETGMQLYFLDAQGNKVDSLFSDIHYLIESAATDSNGDVTAPTQTVSFITFDADRVDKIKNSQRMLIRTNLSTANQGNTPVRIMTHHHIGVKVGMKVKLTN